MTQKSFTFFRFMYIAIDKTLTPLFGLGFRQKYVRFGYLIKSRLYPMHGVHTPSINVSGSSSTNDVWLPPSIPKWVIKEMQDLGKSIDPAIYPTDAFLSSCHYYSYPVIPGPGLAYESLMAQCTTNLYTHCFVIPWLKKGGADLVILKHLELVSSWPNAKALVIMTEAGDSPWIGHIPSNIDVIEASKLVSKISHDEFILVLARMLVQLKIDVLHIINSRHAWEVICKHGLAVKQQTNIFASNYCDDYDKYGQPVGFSREYLPRSYKHIIKLFTDNEAFPLLLHQTYGYKKEFFSVLKTPIEHAPQQVSRNPVSNKVLWAGRLDRQKRPDILLKIAQSLPDVEFHVYGDTLLDSKKGDVNELKKQPNVIMKGGFNGLESLPFNDFPVFLYTSQWDGVPTILIAAVLASIPVVASSVGGVSDIINSNNAFPILNIEDIEEYVNNIKYALQNKSEAESKALIAKQYVEKEYSKETFEKALMSTSGYFKPEYTNAQ